MLETKKFGIRRERGRANSRWSRRNVVNRGARFEGSLAEWIGRVIWVEGVEWGRWRWDEAVRVERRGEADCHKFKQQLTFRVGGFPQAGAQRCICIAVQSRSVARWKRCVQCARVCARTLRRKERNDRQKGKRKKEHDTSFEGYRLNCSLNAVPDLLIIAAAAGYLYYYPLSICHFIFLLENHPRDFYPSPSPTTTPVSKT